ncbi:MAG: hypothetical protein CO014_02325 [Candidatus Tagabacteria bacterium CG_4_8_14_3_um_filter_41_8]|uniref:Uncharacterized protein n=1 Tax=Candidatus Tagabacteria bacterium CG_4_8_14_3_um_filter_41_8 TaxID=1975018 RepID=A0A2M8G8E9_9BACT|nr:MAG: hypothetical protein CO014_02325 [Candidatus Tagabacteria bacterium CG_4_8_14_3_um_filter_41_8]
MNVKLSDVLFFRYFKLNFQQNIFDVVDMKKNFLFPKAEPPIDFFAQFSVQFRRRAKRGEP